MMRVLSLLLVVLLVNVVFGDPTRPAIPDQFYSEVHVAVNNNNRILAGGGMIIYIYLRIK